MTGAARAAACMLAGVGVFITGAIIWAYGAQPHEASGGGKLDVVGALITLAGVGIFLVPLAILCVKLVQDYRRWKASLTPEQRGLVNAAEITALWAGAIGLHEHNKRVSERLGNQVTYGFDRSNWPAS